MLLKKYAIYNGAKLKRIVWYNPHRCLNGCIIYTNTGIYDFENLKICSKCINITRSTNFTYVVQEVQGN